MAGRKLIVQVIGDTSSLDRALGRSAKNTKEFERSIGVVQGRLRGFRSSIGVAAAGFLGGAGVVSVMKDAVEASSNLAEQMSKSGVVFAQSASAVERWSQTSVKAMGLASDQALEAASSFGALLRPLGVTGQAAAAQSEKLTQLGADLASFYNTSVQDALDAIRSGIVGEAEPLRRYGVLLSEARVKQEALSETGKKSEKALTDQDKVMARLRLVFEDTAQAQGDFTRTSSGLANQQRILQANVRQLEIQIGNALKPTILDIVKRLNEWFSSSQNQQRVTDAVRTAVNLVTGTLKTLKGVLDTVNSVTGSTTNTIKLFVAAWGTFKAASLISNLAMIATNIGRIGTSAEGATGKVALLRTGLVRLVANPYTVAIVLTAVGAEVVARKIKQLQEMALDAEAATFKPGEGVETTLVPRLAKQIEAMKQAGKPSADILKTLRGQLGGSLKADDLIAEAFTFTTSSSAGQKLRDRIKAAVTPVLEEGRKGVDDAVKDTAAKAPAGPSAKLRNTWFDNATTRALTRVEGIRTIQGQLGRLEEIRQLILKRAKATKDVTRANTLEDQAFQVWLQERGLRDQLAQEAASKAEAAAQAIQDAAAKAAEARDAATQKMTDVFGLKLSRAELTKTLSDDLAVLKAWEASTRQRMKVVGRTLELQQQLVSIQGQIAGVIQQEKDAVREAARAAREKAQAEKEAAKQAAEAAREKAKAAAEAAKEKAKAAAQAAAEAAKAAAERARAKEIANQFRALGLGPTGGELVPGVGALAKRTEQLRQRMAAAGSLTPKIVGDIAKIGQVLGGAWGKVGTDVRSKIDEMLDSWADALKEGSKKLDLTKFHRPTAFGAAGAHPEAIAAAVMGVDPRSFARGGRPMIQRRLIQPRGGIGRAPGLLAVPGGYVPAPITINGNVNLHGVQSASELEQQLTKRHVGRAHLRRGSR